MRLYYSRTMKTNKTKRNKTAHNSKAMRDYFIDERIEAGIVLDGWEVKSLRANRIQLKESYAILKDNEAWLINAHISPLPSVSNPQVDPTRTRKLLLNRRELRSLQGKLTRKGYTLIPLDLHWKNNCAKLQLGVGKGKHKYDKRMAERNRSWNMEKRRLQKTLHK